MGSRWDQEQMIYLSVEAKKATEQVAVALARTRSGNQLNALPVR
ncbi:hypothetical protein FHR87_002435 [Azomonas macrocytogenes]|uniref:Uncharacterized protein n=1 Tax=Azomonas macrocytogenes TaxID=69962 RepID=A0A839T7V0_AZOMA|nr:hypothetical protein [Azomonas macrocytogenes]